MEIGSVSYLVNKRVCPNIMFSMLFFFKERKDAENFVYDYYGENSNRIIVPCIAYDCKQIKFRAYCSSTSIKKFWMLKYARRSITKNVETKEVPKGTWVAQSIKCLQ
jgi:hypothetical protein